MDLKKTNRLLIINIIVTVVCIVLVAGSLIFGIIKSNIMEENLISNVGNVKQENLDDLYDKLEQAIKKGSGIISDYSIYVSSPIDENLSCGVTLRVALREYTDTTSVSFYLDDNQGGMIKSGDYYVGTVSVSALKEFSNLYISVNQDGTKKTETISGGVSVIKEVFNKMTASLSGTRIYAGNNLNYLGNINYTFSKLTNDKVTSAKILASVNGSTVWEENLTYNAEAETQTYSINQSFKVGKNDTASLSIQITTQYGFTYLFDIDEIKSPQTIDTTLKISGGELKLLKDKEGTEIYKFEE